MKAHQRKIEAVRSGRTKIVTNVANSLLSASDWRLLITKIDLNNDCIQSINKCFISLRGMSDDESNVSREYLNVEKAKLVASGKILLEKALKHMGRSRTIDSE